MQQTYSYKRIVSESSDKSVNKIIIPAYLLTYLINLVETAVHIVRKFFFHRTRCSTCHVLFPNSALYKRTEMRACVFRSLDTSNGVRQVRVLSERPSHHVFSVTPAATQYCLRVVAAASVARYSKPVFCQRPL